MDLVGFNNKMTSEIGKILIVDDDPIALLITEQTLRKFQVAKNISVVKNGQEALDFIFGLCKDVDGHIICPELIFLDYNMPVMDGKECIKQLFQEKFSNWDKVVIVITSTFLTEKDKDDFSELGAKDFMTKPFTQEKIHDIIARYFETDSIIG